MLQDRNEGIERIDKLMGIISQTALPVSEEDRQKKIEQLEHGRLVLEKQKYHVTTLGVFSTGKSTLLNAMIGGKYLPAANKPTTARITEIRPSVEGFIVLTSENRPTTNILDTCKKLFNNNCSLQDIVYSDYLCLNNSIGEKTEVNGIVITAAKGRKFSVEAMNQILTIISSEKPILSNSQDFEYLEILKKAFSDVIIGLPVDEWMADIVLTDAPGTGSIVDAHEEIINKIIPDSQLVLHIVDAERVGDSADKMFSERIANFQHRKIFYVMNKIDRITDEDYEEAEMLLKKSMPTSYANGCQPEIIKVSSLCALLAQELQTGKITVKDVLDNKQISLGSLVYDDAFVKGDSNQRKRILENKLKELSHFDDFKDRVSSFLRQENKQMAILADATQLITGMANDISFVVNEELKLLKSDKTIESLQKEQEEIKSKRGELQKNADKCLAEYRIKIYGGVCSNGDCCKPIEDIIKDRLEKGITNVDCAVHAWLNANYNEIDENPSNVKQRIQMIIEHEIEEARSLSERILTTAVTELKTGLAETLQSARDLTLGGMVAEANQKKDKYDSSIAWLGIGITSGSVLAGAGTGAGIGAAIGSFCPGAGTAIGASIGAGVGALGGLVGGLVYMGKKGKIKKINKIASQVKDFITLIFINGGTLMNEKQEEVYVEPSYVIIYRDIKNQCDAFIKDLQDKIKDRFNELNIRDQKILQDISKTSNEKENKLKILEIIQKNCSDVIHGL